MTTKVANSPVNSQHLLSTHPFLASQGLARPYHLASPSRQYSNCHHIARYIPSSPLPLQILIEWRAQAGDKAHCTLFLSLFSLTHPLFSRFSLKILLLSRRERRERDQREEARKAKPLLARLPLFAKQQGHCPFASSLPSRQTRAFAQSLAPRL